MSKSRYNKASFRIARRSKLKRVFGLFLKIGLPIVFLLGFIFLARADFLQIKTFEVVGLEMVQPEEIKNVAQSLIFNQKGFYLIPNSNIIFLNKNKLVKELLSNFPRLEKVEINKKFFSRQIELKIAEKKADLLWCSSTDVCFLMTKDGLVFEKTNIIGADFEKSKVFSIEPLNKVVFRGILIGDPLTKTFATPDKIKNYLKLIEIFNGVGFKITSINIESSDKAVAKSNIGDIIFNPEEVDLSAVAQNTVLLIKQTKIKNPTAQFNYIDARFGNKFFYKLY